MKVIATEDLLPFDVDFTLIMHGKIKKHHKVICYTCPYSKQQLTVRVNEPMVAVLKERLARGSTVMVWSKSGYKKAEAVLRALNIDHANLYVTTKFRDYADDKPISEWSGERIWLDPDSGYGK
jgi:hypothetical protein